LPGLPSGWRTLPSARQAIAFTVGDDRIDVTYRFDRGQPSATVGGWRPESLRLNRASPTMVDAEIDGVRRRYHVIRCGPDHFVYSALGSTALREVERFPDPSAIQEAGSLLAPMPGSVVRVEVAEGQHVTAGATVLVLEAMKMEHTVRAPADGIVASIQVAAGEQVDSGQVLAVVHDEQTADA
jgi:acetyl/propionyl-CoA carboxylase alpha subunit